MPNNKPTKRAVQAAIREVMPGATYSEEGPDSLGWCHGAIGHQSNVTCHAEGRSLEGVRMQMLAFCESLKPAHEARRSAQLAESFEKGAQDMARARRTQGNSQARKKVRR